MAVGKLRSQSTWQQKKAQLAVRLRALTQKLPVSHKSGENGSALLCDTALYIHLAANIYFLTSLTPQTQHYEDVESIVNAASHLTTQLLDRLRSQHLWPLFVTALFVVDDSNRMVMLDAFRKIQQKCPILSAGTAERAKLIVEAVWKRNDLLGSVSYGNTWDGLVRQMSEGLSLG